MFNPLPLKFLVSCTSVLLLASFVAGLFSGCQNTESSMQLASSDTSSEKNVSSFTTSDQSSTGNERVVTPDQEMPADLQISGLHYLDQVALEEALVCVCVCNVRRSTVSGNLLLL